MNRRQFTKRAALTLTVAGIGSSAFTAPSCGPSKAKAVRVTGFIIDLSKEALPLLELLGAKDIADLLSNKVLSTLEKLKDALNDASIPEAGTALETVRNMLKSVADALLKFPDSPRRTTIIGILASINVLLLTVEAFVESEMPSTAIRAKRGRTSTGETIRRVFEATRF
jgi:hypothetical protein